MKITKGQLKQIILEEYRKVLNEAPFAGLPGYDKNKPIDVHSHIGDPANQELRDEIIDLINRSYAYTKAGKNFDYSEPEHLMGPKAGGNYDLDSMIAWDIDDDPQPDVVRGMKNKGGKMKLTISGQDGSDAATKFSISDTKARLLDGGHFAEMSGASAGAMMKQGIPAVTDEATVRALLPGKEIIWYGKHPEPESFAAKKTAERGPDGRYDGWYERTVSGNVGVKKMIFGAV